jgi:response regulator of citrate/malate metabolism
VPVLRYHHDEGRIMTTQVHEIVSQIEARLEDVEDALREAQIALRAVEGERTALRKALAALNPDTMLVVKKKSAPRPQRKQVSERLARRVLDVVERSEESVTAMEVAAEVGCAKSAARGALDLLRARGYVRLAGIRDGTMHGRRPAVYARTNLAALPEAGE